LENGDVILGGNTNALKYCGLVKLTPSEYRLLQTISFEPIENKKLSDASFELNAQASSGLPISYSTTTPSIISVADNTVSLKLAGTASLVASQSGNEFYKPAHDVIRSFVIEEELDPGTDPVTGVMPNKEVYLSVYPNPADNDLYIESSLNNIELKFFDILGKNIASEFINRGTTKVDISKWSAGLYHCIVSGNSKTIKFVRIKKS
jgi:hypothetical protein